MSSPEEINENYRQDDKYSEKYNDNDDENFIVVKCDAANSSTLFDFVESSYPHCLL